MMRFLLLIVSIFILSAHVFAYESCIISADGKLTDISIEDNTIVDVYPLITIMNEKNTLFIQPIKTGETQVCLLKDGKEKVLFKVLVKNDETLITGLNGFEVFSLDDPPGVFEIDEPPTKLGVLGGE